ncbi:MAG: DUF3147 family protein [Candidatus Micrarchaeota archaeon]
MDIFWLKLVLSFFVGGLYVAFTIFLSEKLGSKIGGILLGLPSTTLVSLIFIYWTQGTETLLLASAIIPAVMAINLFFVITFISLYNRGINIAFVSAVLVWAILALIIVLLNPNLFFSVLVFIFTFGISMLLLGKYPHTKLGKIHSSRTEFTYRSVFAGGVISSSVLAANYVGAVWGGVLGTFPAAFSSSLYLLSKKHGFAFASSVAKNIPFGTIGTVIFAISLSTVSSHFDIVISFIISYLLSLFYAVLVYFVILKK